MPGSALHRAVQRLRPIGRGRVGPPGFRGRLNDPVLGQAEIRLRGDAVPKGCPFLYPGDVPGQPVVDLKRFWERMRVQAEIPDVRIHDLRHTFASLLDSGGASLEMIGRLLGHTQIGTTQRYAQLIDSPLRAGVNAVGEMLKPRLKVVAADGGATVNRANVA